MLALAPRHGLNGVGVVVLRTYGLVDVGRLRVLCLQCVYAFGNHLVVAQDAVEVSLHTLPRRPFQRHGTLQGIGLDGVQLHVIFEDVVFQFPLVLLLGHTASRVKQWQGGIARLHMEAE